ncbi:MAG: diacylglycerol kinase family protein [Patescibacteria group bacterium]|nr:diacylglycerol kinase family protein [Patescibacteria group bacterium]MDD5490565.1 diacylglycerol kinase family protein [Patescibacteria group bacterium]
MKVGTYGNIFAGRRGAELYGITLQESPPFLYVPKKEKAIRGLLEKIRRDKIDVLFIYGGDGTLHRFLTDWFNFFGEEAEIPLLVPLHGGTMDIAATALGIPHNSAYAVTKIISLLRKEENVKKFCRGLSLLKVSGSESENLYGLEVALGPAVNFLKEYENGPKGLWQVAKIFIFSILAVLIGWPVRFQEFLRKLECSAEIDGVKIGRREFTVLYCSVIHRVIFGFRPFRDTHGLRGFRFLAYAVSPLAIVSRLPFLAYAIIPKSDRYINSSAEEITLAGFEKTMFTVDGDIYESQNSVKVEEGPRVRFFSFKKFN